MTIIPIIYYKSKKTSRKAVVIYFFIEPLIKTVLSRMLMIQEAKLKRGGL